MGPAVVVDCRALLAANTAKGKSAQSSAPGSSAGRRATGRFQAGDVPLLYSTYTDRHYKPFPDGNRFKDRLLWNPLIDKSVPAWVVLSPDAVELLFERGVAHIATDAPSFGAAEEPQESHVAGLKHGMTWTEQAVRLGTLPQRGAFFVCAPVQGPGAAGGHRARVRVQPARRRRGSERGATRALTPPGSRQSPRVPPGRRTPNQR